MDKSYTKNQVFEIIVKTIKENYYAVKDLEMSLDTPLKGGDIIDSFGLINIVVKLEDIFKIKISDRKWQKLYKISDAVDLIYGAIK